MLGAQGVSYKKECLIISYKNMNGSHFRGQKVGSTVSVQVKSSLPYGSEQQVRHGISEDMN